MSQQAPAPALPPWQEPVWQRLSRGEQVPVLLLAGAPGIGKMQLAQQLVRRHLCLQDWPENPDCGCRSCLLYSQGAHPDFLQLQPTNQSGSLSVAQAREARDFATLTASVAGGRAVLLDANSLTWSAANSLLKLLEEPPPSLLAILVSSRPALLPPTLLSRMPRHSLERPDEEQSLQWYRRQPEADGSEDDFRLLLRIGNGGPVAALRQLDQGDGQMLPDVLADVLSLVERTQDAVSIAERWVDMGSPLPLQLCWQLLAETAIASASASTQAGAGAEAGAEQEDNSQEVREDSRWRQIKEALLAHFGLSKLCDLEEAGQECLHEYGVGGRNKKWLFAGFLLRW